MGDATTTEARTAEVTTADREAGSRLLRRALAANAVFSALSGLALLAAAGSLGASIGVSEPWILRGLGAGLLLFALQLARLAREDVPDRSAVLAVSGADFAWVAGSAVLLAGFPELLTPAGEAAVAAVAVAVAVLGAGQLAGVRRARLP